ncbi:MAG TPA: helix-hairpin-helix domain-containing protein [Bryobacteraceae bacterium]|nr:helix-hairpin-helix domain-containing protein [Bryobacteraceae bacterium]
MRYSFLIVATFYLQAQDLPDAPGKAVVVKLCSGCHGLATVIGLRRTKTGWEKTVDDMAQRGAKGTDEEFDTAVAYLSRYLGKVNVNTASAQEIQDIADLTAQEAAAIIGYRSQNGAYKEFTDLEKVPDLDAKRLDARRNRFVFR